MKVSRDKVLRAPVSSMTLEERHDPVRKKVKYQLTPDQMIVIGCYPWTFGQVAQSDLLR